MSTWKTAHADNRLNTSRQNGWLYVQWHHGTDSRKDALPEGGWEIEKAKYPGLQLTLPGGKVLHGNAKLLDCWVAESLTVAVLATRTVWYVGPTNKGRPVPAYEPGAWSRFYVLAYVADIERLAVFTVRSTASQALGQQLRLYESSVLALAQREVPDLPPSVFWLTIAPGPVESRGEAGNVSVTTPPLVRLPNPGDEAAVVEWLDANFVGQEMLDRFTQFLPEIERFRGASGLGADPLRTEPVGAAPASEGPTETDGFDAMPSATEEPVVKRALAQAEARRAKGAPVANGAGRADSTAFWSQARARGVDRVRALAIVATTSGDWAAAVKALGEAA